MDLHVYALLKRKYNELAEEVEGIVDESAELTEEAKAVLEEVKASLSEVEPLIESAKVNANEAEELVDKAKSLLESIEPEITELREVLEQVKQNVHTGEYESDRAYLKGNETLYNGSTYRALEDVTGVLPTDTSKWQLVAQRGVDGEGAVSSVNNIAPDENGNVDLGDITTSWADLEGKPEVLTKLNDKDGDLYYNISKIATSAELGNVQSDLYIHLTEFDKHELKSASEDVLGHVKVGNTLKVDGSGRIDVDSSKFVTVPSFNAEVDWLNTRIDSTNDTATDALLKANEAFQRGTEVKKDFVDTFSSKIPEESVSTEMSWGTLLFLMGEHLGSGMDEYEVKRYLGAVFLYLIGLEGKGAPSIKELYGEVDISNFKVAFMRTLGYGEQALSSEGIQRLLDTNYGVYLTLNSEDAIRTLPSTEEQLREVTTIEMLELVTKIMYSSESIQRDFLFDRFSDIFRNLNLKSQRAILERSDVMGRSTLYNPKESTHLDMSGDFLEYIKVIDEIGTKRYETARNNVKEVTFRDIEGGSSTHTSISFPSNALSGSLWTLAIMYPEYRNDKYGSWIDFTLIVNRNVLPMFSDGMYIPIELNTDSGSFRNDTPLQIRQSDILNGYVPIRYNNDYDDITKYVLLRM